MDAINILRFIDNAPIFEIIAAFILAFIFSLMFIPPVVIISRFKRLLDIPSGRHVHARAIPRLGGIAIALSIIFSLIIFCGEYQYHLCRYYLLAFIILALLGVRDDLLSIRPYQKVLGILLSTVILFFLADMQFHHMAGFLGLDSLNIYVSFLFTVFLVLLITNSLNLMDGIDGLASGLGMLMAVFFGIYFFIIGELYDALFSAVLLGALTAFFYFNVFAHRYKIFMGDTGSLILGFSISILLVHFNELSAVSTSPYAVASAPAVAFAIVLVPLMDCLKVVIIRVYNHRSISCAGREHLHHYLLALNLRHRQATTIILGLNAIPIIMSLLFNNIGLYNLITLNVLYGAFAVTSPNLYAYIHRRIDSWRKVKLSTRDY
ncbi:MAG: glycosyltransferase family 4 protein [Bacteroidales bacterium]